MAYADDLYNKMRRSGQLRSAFPAANAINSTPQGQTLIRSGFSGGGGYDPSQDARAASASRPRPNMNDYSWITTPSGGQMRVPTASLGNVLAKGTSLTGSQVTQVGNQLPIDRNAAYAKGYGAPSPVIQSSVSGPVIAQGGVLNPVENISPQQRIQYGVGGTLDYLRSNPALAAAGSFFGGVGKNIASWFGSAGAPSMPPSVNAQPSPTPDSTPFAYPTPTPTPPRRYTDLY